MIHIFICIVTWLNMHICLYCTLISNTASFPFNSFHALLLLFFPLCLDFLCKLQPPPQPHTHTHTPRVCLSCRPPSVGSNEGGRVLFWLHACAKFSLVWQLMERERSVNLIKDLPLLITACQVAVLIAPGSTFASLTLFFILHSFSSFLLFVCLYCHLLLHLFHSTFLETCVPPI